MMVGNPDVMRNGMNRKKRSAMKNGKIRMNGMNRRVGMNRRIGNPKSEFPNPKLNWRRGQDSNLQAVSRGSFQDYCLTN